MMDGISGAAQAAGESQEGQVSKEISWSERMERMRLALDERDRQAKLLQRRLARIEEALGLPPLA